MKTIKQDSYLIGVIIGIILPFILLGVIYLFSVIIGQSDLLTINPKIILLAIIGNLLFIRLYFINWKFEKSGGGVVISSFILVSAYFLLINTP